MVMQQGASQEQTPTQGSDVAELLAKPEVQAAIAQAAREAQEQAFKVAEAEWQERLAQRDEEWGKKSNTWGNDRRTLQDRLDLAEAQVEVAKLADDAQALARSRAQVSRLEREAQAKAQEADGRLSLAHAGETALEMFISAMPPDVARAIKEVQQGLREQQPSYRLFPKLQEALKGIGSGAPRPTGPAPTGNVLAGVPQGSAAQSDNDFWNAPMPKTAKERAENQAEMYRRLGVRR